jgi:AcrR family transcriptional regulator
MPARGYHHGDLRRALVDVGAALVREAGPPALSMAEASRRAGVSIAAPYRHFPDREALAAAVAARGYDEMGAGLARAMDGAATPQERLARAVEGYVAWAAANPGTFALLFGSGLDKRRHPELLAAAQGVLALLLEPARSLAAGGEDRAGALATAIGVLGHGYATLLLDGSLGTDDAAAARAADTAARATRALLRGRRELTAEG